MPKLITFDGEARSGKGTIVQMTKSYLRDEGGHKPMLIDRGQAFRALVVAASRAGVDMDSPHQIDAFLADESNVATCVQFVKDVYHMGKDERDSLLYTNEVGENSAKIGARPASQEFVKMLTKKWVSDAGDEGYDVVLIDGRALESIATEMDKEGLCDYVLGLYFICDPQVGARRTLGHAARAYGELTTEEKTAVDALVAQINARNQADMTREVERLVRPVDAVMVQLPDELPAGHERYLLDTSPQMTKNEMSAPVYKMISSRLRI